MDGYRIPTIAITRHDPGALDLWTALDQALNSGDPRGTAVLPQRVLPLQVPSVVPARLTGRARRALERAYATIEITDSVAQMGGHQVALVPRLSRAHSRGRRGARGRRAERPRSRYHEMTAVLDKIAAGELLGTASGHGRATAAIPCPRATARAQQAERDTEAATINMQLDDVA